MMLRSLTGHALRQMNVLTVEIRISPAGADRTGFGFQSRGRCYLHTRGENETQQFWNDCTVWMHLYLYLAETFLNLAGRKLRKEVHCGLNASSRFSLFKWFSFPFASGAAWSYTWSTVALSAIRSLTVQPISHPTEDGTNREMEVLQNRIQGKMARSKHRTTRTAILPVRSAGKISKRWAPWKSTCNCTVAAMTTLRPSYPLLITTTCWSIRTTASRNCWVREKAIAMNKNKKRSRLLVVDSVLNLSRDFFN